MPKGKKSSPKKKLLKQKIKSSLEEERPEEEVVVVEEKDAESKNEVEDEVSADDSDDDLKDEESSDIQDSLAEIMTFIKSQQTEIQTLKEELKTMRNSNVISTTPVSVKERELRRQAEHKRVTLLSTPLVSKNRSNLMNQDYGNDWNIHIHPEKFAGSKDENINVWLFQFEQSMELNRVPESFWTKVSFQYLKENAATWYLSSFTDSDPSEFSWETFKEGLRNAFQPSNYLDKLRDHVFELRQGNDFDAYVKDMRLSLMQLSDMSEIDKIRCFLRGLKKRTKEWISFERPATLQQAITLATHFEYSHYGGKNDVIKPKYEKKSKIVECHYCHRNGHYSNECRKKEMDKLQKKETYNVNNNNSKLSNKITFDKKLAPVSINIRAVYPFNLPVTINTSSIILLF